MEDMAKKANDVFDAFICGSYYYPIGLKRFYNLDNETRANVHSAFVMIYPSLNENADTNGIIAEIVFCVYMAQKRTIAKILDALLEATR